MPNLNINNISNIVQSGDVEKLFSGNSSIDAAPSQEAGKTFSDILKQSVDQVNLYQTQADTAIKELVAGRNKNIHETMLTIERADSSLKLMMQVRNKILDAYREVMRMQV